MGETNSHSEVPTEVFLAATYPIAEERLSPQEEERIARVVRATYVATCAWLLGPRRNGLGGDHPSS